MRNTLAIAIGKSLSFVSKRFGLGHGSTWPGEIALHLNKHFIRDINSQQNLKTFVIAGTNGKTTTSMMLRAILEADGKTVVHNESGANLLNGIASSLIIQVDQARRPSHAIFEVDENSLSPLLQELHPDYLVLLNLFRDQLDRYGEVRTIAAKWREALATLDDKTQLILNADDPQIAYLGKERKNVKYFGLSEDGKHTQHEHATDSTYCPQCRKKLSYTSIVFSHLGKWSCPSCGLRRPTPSLQKVPHLPLPGTYNQYNTLAAVLAAKTLNIENETIKKGLQNVTPAFGRQEEFSIQGKRIKIFLCKNPAGMNEALKTIKDLGTKYVFLLLNDRVPDGRDVSWIWDVDFETLLPQNSRLFSSGDRAFDMSLRLKYTLPLVKHVDTYPELNEETIHTTLAHMPESETLYILPTYSAMLEIRKILTGKSIL